MTKGVEFVNDKGLDAYILLDRSGSMASLWVEAIGSINTYITKLKEEETDNDTLTIATFDDGSFDINLDAVKLKDLKGVNTDISSPRGGTPLFDSTAKLINRALDKGSKNAVIVVMTDGYENMSREYKRDDVTAIIKKAEQKGYQVIFLGASFDVTKDATALGLSGDKFLSAGKGKLGETMGKAAFYSRSYASEGTSMSFTDEDKTQAL